MLYLSLIGKPGKHILKNETASERENGSRKKRKEQEVELWSKKRLFMEFPLLSSKIFTTNKTEDYVSAIIKIKSQMLTRVPQFLELCLSVFFSTSIHFCKLLIDMAVFVKLE